LQGAHLVAYALDAVLPPASCDRRGTLIRRKRRHLAFWEDLLDLIARSDGPRGTRSRRKAPDPPVAYTPDRLDSRVPRNIAVKTVVGHELKLRKRLILRILAELLRPLQGEDDVRFGPGSQVKPRTVPLYPQVSFFAHVVRHDNDRFIAHEPADIGDAYPEGAGRRPEGRMLVWDDLAVRAAFYQHGTGRPHIVGTGLDLISEHDDDVCVDPRHLLGRYDASCASVRVLPVMLKRFIGSSSSACSASRALSLTRRVHLPHIQHFFVRGSKRKLAFAHFAFPPQLPLKNIKTSPDKTGRSPLRPGEVKRSKA